MPSLSLRHPLPVCTLFLFFSLLTLYQEAAIRLEAERSHWFEAKRGVRQGCILSPYRFNIYTDDIMRNVENDLTPGALHEPNVNGVGMGEFRYANDQALLSKSQKMTEQCDRCCEET